MPGTPGNKMNVLLVGGGGREHALAWKLAQSPRLGTLFTTHPENPGIAALARPMGFPFSVRELYRVEQFCRHESIGLVVVGPEEPLAGGIADGLGKAGPVVFGPVADAARLEADKGWSKQFMRAAAIPSAEGRIFDRAEGARAYIESREEPVVVKAAGLAAGKGVMVCVEKNEAFEAIERIMVRREFGEAGDRVVIEERLSGPEVSIFALVDGRNVCVLDACQDHKRLLDGDEGPNTGGMGAYCPAPIVDAKLMEDIQRRILVPTIDSLKREGIEYRGVLYAGLMLTHAGPKVLEYNVRFGDPECQCLMPRIKGDLVEIALATAKGRLDEVEIDSDDRPVCCVVLAAHGYPSSPRKGDVIEGIEEAASMEDVLLFHAGTKRDGQGRLVTNGGRVLNVVAQGSTIEEARARAYEACGRIRFDGMQYRRDIAARAVAATR